VADTAVARLRGILAANMSGAAIEQLLTDVCSELAGCGSYAAAMRERLMAEINAALNAAPVTVTDSGAIVRTPKQPRCCMCSSTDVRYRNYREQPFCWPCADGTSPEAKVQLAAALEAMDG
jgi:hypothetical protein